MSAELDDAGAAVPQGPEFSAEFANTVMDNVFRLWFTPEIERRRAAGLIGDDFVLTFAQALFPEEEPYQVRLNEEVKGLMTIEGQREASIGEQVLISDLEGIRQFELIDEEINCGHFTVIRRGAGNDWMLTFNARAGRKKAAGQVELARQFLASSIAGRNDGLVGPAIDNLFSACELLAKAELIMQRSPAPKSKKHGAISSAINQWGKMGNVHPAFVQVMNRMGNLRSRARYEGTATKADLPTESDYEYVALYLDHLARASAPTVSKTTEGEIRESYD